MSEVSIQTQQDFFAHKKIVIQNYFMFAIL